MHLRTRCLWSILLVAILIATAAASPAGAGAASSSGLHWERISNLPRPAYVVGGSDYVPEILDVSPDGMTMTSTVGDAGWVSYDISDPRDPQLVAKGRLGGHATSINYTPDGRYFLVTGKGSPNYVAVYDAQSYERLRAFTLPAGPDSTAISADGKYAVTGIEDEGNTATPGSIVVFDLDGQPSSWTMREVAIPPDPAMATPTDPQPEYVDIAAADDVAAITLQENDAVLILDVAKGEIEDIWSTGASNQLADLESDERISFTQSLTAPREPDEVSFSADGKYLLMANEGEGGKGGRSATVFDREGNLVWDSGNSLELAEAVRGLYPDERSDTRGSEFEGVDTAVVDGVPWGVVGSERGDALMFLDLSDPTQPQLAQVLASYGSEPEGVLFVPQRRLAISPDASAPVGWSFYELRDASETEEHHKQLLAGRPWYGVNGIGNDSSGRPVVLSGGIEQRLLEVKDESSAPLTAIATAGPILHIDAESPQPLPGIADDVDVDPVGGAAWVDVGQVEPAAIYRLDGDGTAIPVALPAPAPGSTPVPRGIVFSPDGSTLYVACQDISPFGEIAPKWTLYARDQATGAFRTYEVNLEVEEAEALLDAAVTPDGDPLLLVDVRGEAALFRVPLATATPAGAVDVVPAGTIPSGAYNASGPTGITVSPRGDLIVIGGSSELTVDPRRFPPTDAEPALAAGLPSPSNPIIPDLSAETPINVSARVGSHLMVSTGQSSAPLKITAPTTGALLTAAGGLRYGPRFDGGTVLASAADGEGGSYVGGNFTSVGGIPRSGLVHLLPGGAVDLSFDPAPDGKVTSLLRHGATLYVGGEFTNIAGASRTHFAALSTADGSLVAGFGDPAPETGPHALAYESGEVYLGGSFQTLGGSAHHGIGRVDAATGAVDATWGPQLAGTTGTVERLLIGSDGIYLGGEWTRVGASAQAAVVLVRTSDGTVDTGFAPQFQFGGPSRFGGFALRGDQLYLATGNALEGLDTQQRVGRVDAATGAVDTAFRVPLRLVQNVTQTAISPLLLRGGWLYVGHANGSPFSSRRLVRVDPDSGAIDPTWTPALTASTVDVRTLASTDGGVFAGGDFTQAGIQRTVAVYDLKANRLLPQLGGGAETPQLMAPAGGWVYTYTGGRLHRLDPTTGLQDPNYGIDVIGEVRGLTAADGRLYVSGGVSFVDGQPRDGIAAIDGQSGELMNDFHPHIEGFVDFASVQAGTVYVAGDLGQVNGAVVAHLAALDAADGSTRAAFHEPSLPEGPSLTGLLAGADGLFLTGGFEEVGGQPHVGIARLDLSTGAPTAGFTLGFSGSVEEMTEHAGHLVVAGFFAPTETDPHNYGLRALDEQTGAAAGGFEPEVNPASALYSYGTRLLAVSSSGDVAYRSFDVAAPANVTPPELGGSLRQGDPVSCEPGTWADSPTGFVYAWELDGNPVPGESDPDYVPRDADLGRALTCTVQAKNQAGTSAPVTSGAEAILLGVPQATASPALSGTPVVGQSLHCSTGSWSRSPTAFAYRWLRDGTELPDTSADRAVAAEDAGHQLACRVDASNAAGTGTAAVSSPLAVPTPTPAPASVETAATPTIAPSKPQTTKHHAKKRKPCKGKHGKKRKACIRKHAAGRM